MNQSKPTRRLRNLVFHKMHGLGNDFMVIERLTQHVELDIEQVARWGDRHTGIGFDQLLVIDPPSDPDVYFDFSIYNTDGSTAQQCGNGSRAIALLINKLQLSPKKTLIWQSLAGRFSTHYASTEQIEVEMTVPVLDLASIPFDQAHATPADDTVPSFTLQTRIDGQNTGQSDEKPELDAITEEFVVTPVSMGNPHAVMFVDDIVNTDVAGIGAALTAHPSFPERANIGFCQVIDRQFVRLRVFERGVGETRACGSGACAAVVAARLQGYVDDRVKVSLPGGKLRITWPATSSPVTMTGPATLTYTGEIEGTPG